MFMVALTFSWLSPLVILLLALPINNLISDINHIQVLLLQNDGNMMIDNMKSWVNVITLLYVYTNTDLLIVSTNTLTLLVGPIPLRERRTIHAHCYTDTKMLYSTCTLINTYIIIITNANILHIPTSSQHLFVIILFSFKILLRITTIKAINH